MATNQPSLGPTQRQVYRVLERERFLRSGEIADRCGLSASAVRSALDRLVDQGHVNATKVDPRGWYHYSIAERGERP